MTIDPTNLLAILLMGIATYLTRVGGLYLAERLPKTGRTRVALDAVPPAVLTAVIAPAVVAGPAEAVAAAVTVLAALRLPLVAVVAVGAATAAVMRMIV